MPLYYKYAYRYCLTSETSTDVFENTRQESSLCTFRKKRALAISKRYILQRNQRADNHIVVRLCLALHT